MAKKILISSSSVLLCLLLAGLLFSLLTGQSPTDASAQLEQANAANAYLEAGEYEQAEVLYKAIVQDSPGTDNALEAQTKLGVLYIRWDKDREARQTLDDLINGYSSHPDVTEAVWEVCETYLELDQYDSGGEFFQYFLDNRPKDKNSIWMQAGLVTVNIIYANYSKAEALFQEMLSEYSVDNELLADVLINIGSSYFYYAKQFEKANQLYIQAMDKGPDESDEIWAVMGLGMSYAALGNYDEADSAVERLVTDFSDQPEHVPHAVLGIADAYLDSAKEYEKAAELYQLILDRWPSSEESILARKGLIQYEIMVGNIEKADSDVNDLLSDLPAGEDFSEVLVDIADSYEEERKYHLARELYQFVSDNLSAREENGNIWNQIKVVKSNVKLSDSDGYSAAYEKLISDFNEHSQLSTGLREIGMLCLDLQQEEDAAQAFQSASEAAMANEGEDGLFQSWRSLILKYICTEEDTQAQAVIDEFIGDFKGRSEFAEAIDQIMIAYRMKVFYRSLRGEARTRYWVQPVTTWEKVKAAVPNFFYPDPDLYYLLGVCYYQLEQYDMAKAHVNSVAHNWPDERQGKDAKSFVEIIESRQEELQ